jgi:ABC-type lipoprotein release transport system permease subunit
VPGVLEARPVIEGSLILRTRSGSDVVHVRAIDTLQSFPGSDAMRSYEPGPFAPPGTLEDALIERHGIVVSRALASELGLSTGSTVDAIVGRTPIALSVVSIVRTQTVGLDTNTVLVDIGSTSTLLGGDGTLDRIDVVCSGTASLQTVLARLRRVLPPGARVDRSAERIASLERLTTGFRLNANVLAYVALVVGAVLVANSIGISVRRRRPEIAILRSLGATRLAIARAFIIEGALLGAFGGTAGALLGDAFALALSGLGDPASLVETGSQLAGDTVTLVRGIGIGLLLSLAAAVVPAIEAASVLPVTALQIMPSRTTRETSLRLAAAGIALTLASFAAAFGSAPGARLAFAYASAIGVLSGIGLCVPFLLSRAVETASTRVARFPVAGYLAVSRLRANGARLSLTIATLVISVSASVGVATATASFHTTIVNWTLRETPGDLEVRPFGIFNTLRTDSLGAHIARITGVARLAPSDRDAAFFVVAKPDVSLQSLRRAIIAATLPVGVDVRLSRDARAAVEDLFAPSLALASAVGRVSVIIAILGTVATILALAREQQRELALLRVLGLALNPMRRTLAYEALALSAFGALLGVGTGLILGAMLVLVIDPLVSGYPANFVVPLGTTLAMPLAVILIAMLAASLAARSTSARFAFRALQS